MKPALIHADRQTDKYEAICSCCDHANPHKITCDSPGGTQLGHFFGCAKSMAPSSKVCFVTRH